MKRINKSIIKEESILKKQTKKLIAPIVITILLVCYFVFYIYWSLLIYEIPLFINILLIVVSIGLIILNIYMLIERIKEIKGGEEDDLSKY